MANLKKGWALITGALGGVGQALVKEYKAQGYSVIGTDILPKSHIEIDSYLELDLIDFVRCSDYSQGFYLQVQDITANQGIDVLINNAAVQLLGDTSELSKEMWLQTLDVNVTAPFLLSQLFLDDLKSNTGSIINISSIHAHQSKRSFVAYATSKSALSSLTRNMATDLAGTVRVNAIEPAAIDTEMLREGFRDKPEAYEELKSFHPIGRVGQPIEIAKLAVYLSSDNSPFINGACIAADGGISGCLYDPA